MKNIKPVVPLLFIFLYVTAQSQQLIDPILLWPGGAPGATGISNEDKPAIIPFIPEETKRNGTAVLVIPGGAFTTRATDHEGVLVAQWLKKQGITAFLLRYRLRPLYTRQDWLKDGQRGIQYIRMHAAQFHISKNRIGAVGFSAGGELVADMAFHPVKVDNNAKDPLDRISAKTDFMILAYGSMPMPESLDSSILKSLPATFMYCTAEDASHLSGMIELYAKLLHANIPIEGHFFQNGEHGTGFAIGDPVLGEWPKLMHNWLREGGFLTDKTKISLTGVVRLNDSPLVRGMVILTPIDQPNTPQVVVYISNTGTGQLGRFFVPVDHGPIAGNYSVEVRQDATRWMSNSRDPVMIRMMAKQKENTLTDEESKEWSAYIRERDLSPSIINQKVFTKKHPGDKRNYIVDIKDGKELILDIFSK